MTLRDKIRVLAKSEGLSLPNLESKLGFGNGTIVKWDKASPNVEKLKIVADHFNVSLDYLLGRDEKSLDNLTQRDEKDIANSMSHLLEQLDSEALMFDGEALDEESRELLKASLENSLRMAKVIAKQKFTNKRYK